MRWAQLLAAWLVLAVGVAASLAAWNAIDSRLEREARAAFSAQASGLRAAADARLLGYYSVLYGLQGLFKANPHTSREAFRSYVDSIISTHVSRGMRSYSYSSFVREAERSRFEARVRSQGFPQFVIKPPGRRDDYVVVQYIEPFGINQTGMGLDIASDPVRRAGVERTRETGSPAATGRLRLVSAPATADPGVSLRLALYRPGAPLDSVAARRAAFVGVVSATFHVSDLIGDFLWNSAENGLRLRIVDLGTAGALHSDVAGEVLFDSAPEAGTAEMFGEVLPLEVGGRHWQLHFSAPRQSFASPTAAWAPTAALAGGLLISMLLAGLVASLASSSRRAQRMAERITGDLRRSEADLAAAQQRTQHMIEALPNPIFFKGTDGRYLGVNKAWERFFGIGRESFIGKTVHDLYPHDRESAERLHAMDEVLWRAPGSQVYETQITTPDGAYHDAIYYKATFGGPDGVVAGLIGTIIDITDRKLAERRLSMEHAITRVLAEAQSAADAIPRIIRVMCETMGWECGARWSWDAQAQLFRCTETWGRPEARIGEFLAAIASGTIAAGGPKDGLVRRAYASRKPVSIGDVRHEPSFVRAPLVAKAGLNSAFGFPLLLGNEVQGVLEFFHHDSREPDEALRQVALSIGSQIAQFLVRKQAEEAVRFVASHDTLTGLPNRMMFNQRLEHAISQAQRHGRRLAILFIDLDRFKLINDTLGHEAGDTLLRAVAQRVRDCLRESDTVGRLGGDEFVVLLEEVPDPLYLGSVSQRLIEALGRTFVLEGREYHVTASIGVSTFPDDADTMQGLLKNADIAMYRAKEHGRNTFQFYSEQMNVHSVERLTLETDLRRALERGELLAHYQPQLAIRGRQVTGVEALLRWRHPSLGLISPGRFIPVAEESGLIVPIGEWVLHTACTQYHRWREAGVKLPRISVNLSPRQFQQGNLTRIVERALAASGCPAQALELEITESMVMHNPEAAVTLMHELREMGVQVAIDDFGTGYSSLGALKRFPVQNLKVDRSFVRDLPEDRGDAAIVEAVIVMAHSLGMKVTAEGVETKEQHDFLRRRDCDELQGFLFSAPLAEPELLEFLARASPVRSVN